MKFKLQQWQKVLIGIALGVLAGLTFGEQVNGLRYLGIIFLNMIKMLVVPLIFCTIIYGMTGVEGSPNLGKTSVKALIIFFSTALTAACIGLLTAHLIQPGNTASRDSIIKMIADFRRSEEISHSNASLTDFLIHIIPENVFRAAADGNILQIIVFAFFCGVVLNKKKSQCEELIHIIHQMSHMLFSMIGIVMKFAPLGVFGYVAFLVAHEGVAIISAMAKLIVTIIVACFLQYLFFGVILLACGKISPKPFYKKILNIQLLAFSTSSSKAVLVPMMETCEKSLGVSREGSRFILPLAAALNMDGGAIYQTSCVIFFSQIYGIHFGWHEYLIIVFMSTIASIGGAGIPSGVLLFLGMVLNSVGMPMDGVLVIATVDRVLDMFTTVMNVTGDIFATLMVDASEKKLNKKLYYS